MIQTVTMLAGGRLQVDAPSRFFRIMEATASVSVFFYQQGKEVARSEGVRQGYAETFDQEFDRLVIINGATGQSIQFAARQSSEIAYDLPPVGNVNVVNVAGVMPSQSAATQAQRTVTNASAQLIAANAARSFLLIQNKSLTGTIWLNLAGAAATQANGVKLEPGESLELSGVRLPSGAVFAIGDIASNADVASVEQS